jgi:hypothetical protein
MSFISFHFISFHSFFYVSSQIQNYALVVLLSSSFFILHSSVHTVSVPKDTPWVDIEGTTMEEFMDGQGIMNSETSNLLNVPNEFTRRGGYDRYFYIGEDGRLNDYLPTSIKVGLLLWNSTIIP